MAGKQEAPRRGEEILAALGRSMIHSASSVRQAFGLCREMSYWTFVAPWKRSRSNVRWESAIEQG
ncbi:MAG: hypothetical protein V3U53_05255, partial [bacterium]